MEAPDKIYLAFKDGFVAQSANNKDAILKKYVPLTYIRKEALLEWLKEKISDYWADGENEWGIYPYAFEEVINKLNEM